MTESGSTWPADAINALVDRYERPLLAYAGRMLGGDWQGAQDAVQETFLRLCREDPAKIESRVAAWLFSVCRTRVIDMQRTNHSTPFDSSQIAVADKSPDVSESVIKAEDRDQLYGLVEKLTNRQQEVLRLRLQAGLSYREIAEVTGLTIGNVGFHPSCCRPQSSRHPGSKLTPSPHSRLPPPEHTTRRPEIENV